MFRPKLIILMGLPGSGKSMVAKYLQDKYNYQVLSGENITYEIFGDNLVDSSGFIMVYAAVRDRAKEFIDLGMSVVIDGTNLRHYFRQQIYDEVRCKLTKLIYLKVDDKTALERISKRGVDYSDKNNIKSSITTETFAEFKKQIEEPLLEEQAVILNSDEGLLEKIDTIFSDMSTNIVWNGQEITYTWISTTDFDKYKPITQVYGICLNDKKEVLICREPGQQVWGLPGGTPEKNETPVKTLERELMEEVDIIINNIKPIGLQQVNFHNNPKKSEGDIFYQARYVCKIVELLPQTIDPDTKLQYERKFVPLSDLNKFLNWGNVGDIIVEKALLSHL